MTIKNETKAKIAQIFNDCIPQVVSSIGQHFSDEVWFDILSTNLPDPWIVKTPTDSPTVICFNAKDNGKFFSITDARERLNLRYPGKFIDATDETIENVNQEIINNFLYEFLSKFGFSTYGHSGGYIGEELPSAYNCVGIIDFDSDEFIKRLEGGKFDSSMKKYIDDAISNGELEDSSTDDEKIIYLIQTNMSDELPYVFVPIGDCIKFDSFFVYKLKNAYEEYYKAREDIVNFRFPNRYFDGTNYEEVEYVPSCI